MYHNLPSIVGERSGSLMHSRLAIFVPNSEAPPSSARQGLVVTTYVPGSTVTVCFSSKTCGHCNVADESDGEDEVDDGEEDVERRTKQIVIVSERTRRETHKEGRKRRERREYREERREVRSVLEGDCHV